MVGKEEIRQVVHELQQAAVSGLSFELQKVLNNTFVFRPQLSTFLSIYLEVLEFPSVTQLTPPFALYFNSFRLYMLCLPACFPSL